MIDQRLDAPYTEQRCGSHRVGPLRRGKQRLRRHAAVVQSVATHFVFFDKDHALAVGGGSGGKRKPARARADDAEIGLDYFVLRRSAGSRTILGHDGLSRIGSTMAEAI